MSDRASLHSIVDDILSARETAVIAGETFIVKLLDVVLLASAERLVEEGETSARTSAVRLRDSVSDARKIRRRAAN